MKQMFTHLFPFIVALILAGIMFALQSMQLIGVGVIFIASLLFSYLYKYLLLKDLSKVGDFVNELKRGNVSAIFPTGLNKEFDAIAHAVEDMTKDVRMLIGKMLIASEKLILEIKNLSEKGNQISESSERVASHVTEIAGSMTNVMSETDSTQVATESLLKEVNNVLEYAEATIDISKGMSNLIAENAEHSKILAEKMKSSAASTLSHSQEIQALQNDMKKIEEIIRIITDISDRTNLLALNASIEAARAGEAGRGFAVVAEEVRLLAEQSSHSTDNIVHIIKSLVQKINLVSTELTASADVSSENTKFADNSIEVMGKVQDSVKQTLGSVTNIKDLCLVQSKQSEHLFRLVEGINASSTEIGSSIQNSAALSEEQASAMIDMSKSLDQLYTVSQDLDTLMGDYKKGLSVDPTTQAKIQSTLKEMRSYSAKWGLTKLEDVKPSELEKLEKDNGFQFVAVCTAKGRGYAFSQKNTGAEGIDISYRPFFITSVRGEDFISEPYISMITNDFCITLATPLLINNHIEGILVIDLNV